jgi:hypothetical protein
MPETRADLITKLQHRLAMFDCTLSSLARVARAAQDDRERIGELVADLAALGAEPPTIEPVRPEAMTSFALSDHVRIIDPTHASYGKTGIVVAIEKSKGLEARVDLDPEFTSWECFVLAYQCELLPHQCELVAEPTPPAEGPTVEADPEPRYFVETRPGRGAAVSVRVRPEVEPVRVARWAGDDPDGEAKARELAASLNARTAFDGPTVEAIRTEAFAHGFGLSQTVRVIDPEACRRGQVGKVVGFVGPAILVMFDQGDTVYYLPGEIRHDSGHHAPAPAAERPTVAAAPEPRYLACTYEALPAVYDNKIHAYISRWSGDDPDNRAKARELAASLNARVEAESIHAGAQLAEFGPKAPADDVTAKAVGYATSIGGGPEDVEAHKRRREELLAEAVKYPEERSWAIGSPSDEDARIGRVLAGASARLGPRRAVIGDIGCTAHPPGLTGSAHRDRELFDEGGVA